MDIAKAFEVAMEIVAKKHATTKSMKMNSIVVIVFVVVFYRFQILMPKT